MRNDQGIWPQLPQPCSSGNTCTSLGCPRRRSLLSNFFRRLLTPHARSCLIGTHSKRWTLAVGILSVFSFAVSHLWLLVTPEIAPGALIVSSDAASTASSGTFPTSGPAITSDSRSQTSLSSPTSHSSGDSSSKSSKLPVGAIAGASVGGVAVIAIAVLGIFYLRRQPPKAPSAAFMTDGVPKPHNESIRPLTEDVTPASSMMLHTPVSTMRVYVCIFVLSFRSCLLIFFCIPRTRMTRSRFQGTQELGVRQKSLLDSLYHCTLDPKHSGQHADVAGMRIRRPAL